MAETDTDLLSYRRTLKMVLGNVCIVICSHVYKIHTCPLKTLWKIFSNIRKKNLWHKKFQSLSIFVCVYTSARVCVCACVCVSHKNKHGHLRKGGKCISHVLARPSRTWWSSPPSVPQASETLSLMSSKPSTEAAKLRTRLSHHSLTQFAARIPRNGDRQSDCARWQNTFNNILAKTKCWSNAILVLI